MDGMQVQYNAGGTPPVEQTYKPLHPLQNSPEGWGIFANNGAVASEAAMEGGKVGVALTYPESIARKEASMSGWCFCSCICVRVCVSWKQVLYYWPELGPNFNPESVTWDTGRSRDENQHAKGLEY